MEYYQFMLLCLVHFKLVYGCSVLYITQPLSTLQCNPMENTIEPKQLNLNFAMKCEAASNEDIYIEWYHNNTSGATRSLGGGEQRYIKDVLLITDGERQKFNFLTESTLEVKPDVNLPNIFLSALNVLDKRTSGEYWCQLTKDGLELRRSNVLKLESGMAFLEYDKFPPCNSPQSESNQQCALVLPSLNTNTKIATSSTASSLAVSSTAIIPSTTTSIQFSTSTLMSYTTSTTVSTVNTDMLVEETPKDVTMSSIREPTSLPVAESNSQSGNVSMQSSTEDSSDWERVISRYWKMFIIGIGAALLVMQMVFITMIACICICRKRSRKSKGGIDLAVVQAVPNNDNNIRTTPPTIRITSQLLEKEQYCTISPHTKKRAPDAQVNRDEGFYECGGSSVELIKKKTEDEKPEYDSLPPLRDEVSNQPQPQDEKPEYDSLPPLRDEVSNQPQPQDEKPEYDSLPPLRDEVSYQPLQKDKMNDDSIYDKAECGSYDERSFKGSTVNLKRQHDMQTSPKYDEVEPKNIPFPYNVNLSVPPSPTLSTPTKYESLDINTMCYLTVYSTLEKHHKESNSED